jgi:alanine dehydrogenase
MKAGAVARTSTLALTDVTIPYALRIADLGCNKALAKGVNVMDGNETNQSIADSHQFPYVPVDSILHSSPA